MSSRPPSVVFAGCARDCALHLPGVLANLEGFASYAAAAAFVVAENDSRDQTREVLGAWLAARQGRLLGLGDLQARIPSRTARIAAARNACLEFLRASPFAGFEYLVVVDFDDVNAVPIPPQAFGAALGMLAQDPRLAAVFACSDPVYYDVWALRHPAWCPNDVWAEVNTERQVSREAAIERYVYRRQIVIPASAQPIAVQSAFGGLAIYRMSATAEARYAGLTPLGTECCEHVEFNRSVAARGALLISPGLRNRAPGEHLRPIPGGYASRVLNLTLEDRSLNILAPPEHRLDHYRSAHPLYDRFLPRLARELGAAAPGELVVDVGANIGDTIALMRLEGCANPILAVEPSPKFHTFLALNAALNTAVYRDVELCRAFVGPTDAALTLEEHNGTAASALRAAQTAAEAPTIALDDLTTRPTALVKTDTDGYDAEVLGSGLRFLASAAPVIWAEAETRTAAAIDAWSSVIGALSASHPQVIAFDNFGFPVAYGSLADKWPTIRDLMDYSRRHAATPVERGGEPRIHYLDLALFPGRFLATYRMFVDALGA